jgi:ribosome-associated protein
VRRHATFDPMPLPIPLSEIRLRASRSSGPGGQHVNTSSTRMELSWNARATTALSAQERSRVLTRLAHRLDSRGNLRLVSGATRSQLQNREDVIERLHRLLRDAVKPVKPRKKTRPTRAAREERLAEKKRRSTRKAERRRPAPDE